MNDQTCRGLAHTIAGVTVLLAFAAVPTSTNPYVAATPLETEGCDFDADGFDDEAIGVPGEGVGGEADAGAVNVLYGGANGLAADGNQVWHQDSPNIEGTAAAGDRFGEAIACGDFNGDRFDDLAAGVLGEDSDATDGGSVNVIYGSRVGLVAAGDQRWSQDSAGVGGSTESRDRFGSSVTTGDFDADGFDDLAVGVPAEKVGSADGAKMEGAVTVLYGGTSGLSATGDQTWTQNSTGIAGAAEPRDLFGTAVTTGDFDGDRFDDLAVGVPAENLDDTTDAGAVNVIYGSAAGLTAAGDQAWSQNSTGISGSGEAHDRFGFTLASGDFDKDGRDDLGIGVPGEDREGVHNTGVVNVLYGSAGGLDAAGDQQWSQGTTGIAGDDEPNDRFGTALTAGNFDAAGGDDLAVGAPWDSVAGEREVGTVNVLYGTGAAGLDDAGDEFWHQDQPNVAGGNEVLDRFGDALANGDFDRDGRSDLVVGLSGESVAGIGDIGAVDVLYGTGGGLTGAGSQFWHQNSPGILGAGEKFDRLSGRLRSDGVYRIAYADGTRVAVSGDRLTHSPQERIDMHGVGGFPVYLIVAARSGTIEKIVDDNAEPTSNNNYVWISHSGGEWSKYTHFVTGSVPNSLSEGDHVSVGTFLGIEGDVGQASGEHLHFEIAVPDDPADPIDSAGFIKGENRDPVICRIPGNTFLAGETYTADDC